MLFDHGVDCFTAVLNNMILMKVLLLGNGMINFGCLLISTLPFYYACLEHYYTGALLMQRINGIDDGSIVYMIFCFLTALYGPENLW